ncbi:MAG: PAS domain S-box protein [Gammaproteobacteria bacterium]|nr:PAS domain S-box protein [Gammaproteobacteria bacterium]
MDTPPPQFEDFFENSPVPLHCVGPDGTILRANQAELDMLGYSAEEYVGRHIAEFHVECPVIDDMLCRLTKGETLHKHPARLRCKDGSIRDVEVSSNVLFENGRFVHTRCFTIDVTDRKRAEAALRGSEHLFSEIIQALPAAVYVTDADGVITHFNQAAVELAGREPQRGVDRWCVSFKLYRPDGTHLPHGECPMALTLKTGRPVHGEEIITERPDGSRHHVAPYATPLRDDAGRIVGGINMLIDVTERRRAEEQLRASEESYRRLAELLPVAVYTCDAAGRITYFNEHAARLWGREPQLGSDSERYCGSFELFLPDGSFLPHDECPLAEALREGRRFRNAEVFIRRPDGTRVQALVNVDPILDADGRIVGAINAFQDATALKRAERALRQQKDDLQTLLDTLPVAVLIAHDWQCRRISGNRAAAAMLRMPLDGNFSRSAPPDELRTHFRFQQNGRDVPVPELPMQRAARGEVVQGEEVDNVFDDGSVIHTMISAQPLADERGRARGAVAALLDITAHKRAEAALRDADRRKDEFLATLSHELRNPLAPIRTALSMLGRCRDDPARFERSRAIMERQVSQLVRLIDDLLDVARISRGKIRLRMQRIDLGTVIRQAVETSRPAEGADQPAIEVETPERPIELFADPVRLTQVFGNLLSNAYKYTGAGGSIRVRAERRGGRAVVAVRDDGQGIPPDQLERIFQMFSQVEQPECGAVTAGGGLGIGLSLARRLVEMHGGSIDAHSEGLGRGTEFVVRLPLAAGAETEAGDANGAGDAAGSLPCDRAPKRRILVVDDNVDAAETLAMLLEAEGHVTGVVHDGPSALREIERFEPSVILLDIGMPNMDGYQVCREIRRKPRGRDIVVAALTGWGQEEDRRRSVAAGFDAHLVKPVEIESLQRLLEGEVAASAAVH